VPVNAAAALPAQTLAVSMVFGPPPVEVFESMLPDPMDEAPVSLLLLTVSALLLGALLAVVPDTP
jgi:hypothetical protein